MNIGDFAFWKKKDDTDDIIRHLIEKSCNILIEKKQFPFRMYFDVPRSNYLAHIIITKDLIHEGDQWYLQVGVMEQDSDKMFSLFLNHYPREQLLDELASEKTKVDIFDAIKELCIRADQED